MIISISGLDGSGKTTQAIFVLDYLTLRRKKASYIHMQHHSIFGIISKFLKRYNKKSFNQINKIEFDLSNKSFSKKLISALRKVTYLIDLFAFYFYAFYYKISKRILVCDRYFYDLVVQSTYMKLFGKKFSNFYLKLVPKPSIPIFLELSPDVAFRRANEKNINFFNRKKQLYDSLIYLKLFKIKVTSIEDTKNSIIEIIKKNVN